MTLACAVPRALAELGHPTGDGVSTGTLRLATDKSRPCDGCLNPLGGENKDDHPHLAAHRPCASSRAAKRARASTAPSDMFGVGARTGSRQRAEHATGEASPKPEDEKPAGDGGHSRGGAWAAATSESPRVGHRLMQ
jgi:hypothetical protein